VSPLVWAFAALSEQAPGAVLRIGTAHAALHAGAMMLH